MESPAIINLETGVLATSWSPDGSTVAIGSSDKSVSLWDVHSGKRLRSLEGHHVRSVSFSPDGQTVASGSNDCTVRLWDVQSGRLIWTLKGHSDYARSVSFSSDGRTVASGSDDCTVRLWDVHSGKLLRTLEGYSDYVQSVSFSPDGLTIASGSDDRTVRLWDVYSAKLLRTLEGHSDWVRSVSFSPDGLMIASGSNDCTVRLWEVPSGRLIRTLEGHSDHVQSVSFSPDGVTIASGSNDRTVCLWEVRSGRLIQTFEGHSGRVRSVSFSPDGMTIASGSEDGTVRLWRVSHTSHEELVLRVEVAAELPLVRSVYPVDWLLAKPEVHALDLEVCEGELSEFFGVPKDLTPETLEAALRHQVEQRARALGLDPDFYLRYRDLIPYYRLLRETTPGLLDRMKRNGLDGAVPVAPVWEGLDFEMVAVDTGTYRSERQESRGKVFGFIPWFSTRETRVPVTAPMPRVTNPLLARYISTIEAFKTPSTRVLCAVAEIDPRSSAFRTLYHERWQAYRMIPPTHALVVHISLDGVPGTLP